MRPNASSVTTSFVAMCVVLIAGAGCDRDTPGGGPTAGPGTATGASPSATVSASPSPTVSPTPPPTDPATVFAADGIGPYVVGTAMSDLQARALLTAIVESPLCSDAHGAQATGRYAGKISLTFRSGRLSAIHTNATTVVTPSGARVGMALTEIQGIYGSRGTLINGAAGNKAFSVRVPASALAVVFFLDPTNTRVTSMSGGEAQALEDAARSGEGC